MEQVVPWTASRPLIAPVYPQAENGRCPQLLAVMLRVCLVQKWLSLSDPAMEEALHEMPAWRQFAGLSSLDAILDKATILNFRT
jgi:IS5 family transposase